MIILSICMREREKDYEDAEEEREWGWGWGGRRRIGDRRYKRWED